MTNGETKFGKQQQEQFAAGSMEDVDKSFVHKHVYDIHLILSYKL